MEGREFLKHKYDLHNTPEVESAAKRTKVKTGEAIEKPLDKIQNYLDRFKEITERTDEDEKNRGLKALKKILHKEFIIQPENIPESYYTLQQQIMREQGYGDVEITDELREEAVKVIQADQRASMDEWVNYLASDDAAYPDWAKYWAMRSVLGMSLYDKEEKRFGNRTKNTTAKFPDWNPEALAYVVDVMEKKLSDNPIENPVEEGENEFAEEGKLVSDEEFQKLLTTESFSKYYAFAIEHVVADNSKLFKVTDGEWRIFEEGTDPLELTKTIQGHGTGWCTAGESTAAHQLRDGDFYVYYSNNVHGLPTIPRLAIRMYGDDEIAEVRGVAHKQEIDPYISPVLEEKLNDFGSEGELYKKKAADMKLLTEIDNKASVGEQLNKEELYFLYEMDHEIEGFGYERDPRIYEIISRRNRIEDAKIFLGEADDSQFIAAFLDLKEEKQAKLLGLSVYDDEIEDWSLYLKERNKLVENTVKQLPKIPYELAKTLIAEDNRYHELLLQNYKLIDIEDLLKILPDLAETIHKDKEFAGIYPDLFSSIPRKERLAYLEEQLNHRNYDYAAFMVRVMRELPLQTAKQLVEKGQIHTVAENLESFAYPLDNELALALIEAKFTYQLSDHLYLFKGLGSKVRQAIEDASFFVDLDNSPESFDSPDLDLDEEDDLDTNMNDIDDFLGKYRE